MKQQCEICGEMVSQQDLSKSYKHRCKKCVARLARIDRQAAKQRAENMRQLLNGTGYTLVSPEDRRRERIQIATAILQGMVTADQHYNSLMDMKGLAVTSLKFADALLAEVDKEEEGGSEYADREYSGIKECGDYIMSGTDVWEAGRNGYSDGAADVLADQWRNAEKEQPNDNHMVLVKVDLEKSNFIDGSEEDVCYTTAYFENDVWQFPDDWYYNLKVLEWMPIPKRKGDQ